MWLMYNESIKYSVLGEIPSLPILEVYDYVINNSNEIPPLLESKSKLKEYSLPSIYDTHPHPYAKRSSNQFSALASSTTPSSSPYVHLPSSPLPILQHSTITIPSQLYHGYESTISTPSAIFNNNNDSIRFPPTFYLPSTSFRLKDVSSQSSVSPLPQNEQDCLSPIPTLDPPTSHWKKSL